MRYNQPLCIWNFTLGTYKAKVKLPHTWNVDNEVMRYRGKATYDTAFNIDCSCKDKKVYLKCNAVYHTAKVSVNGRFIGKHSRSGYTPFIMDITDAVEFGKENKIEIDFLLGFDKTAKSWKLWIGKIGAVSYDDDPYYDLKTTKFAEAVTFALDKIEEFIEEVKGDQQNWIQYYKNM